MDIQIAIDKLKPLNCSCGNSKFNIVFELKLLPRLLSPSGTDQILQFPVFVCTVCGEILKPYTNEPLKKVKN